MGWIDFWIVIVLVGSGILGFRRGLLRLTVELAGLVGGILLALYWSGGLVERYAGPLARYTLTYPLVFLAIVGLVLLVAQVVGKVTSGVMQVTFFGWFDHVGGAVAGVAKGALWLSILITMVGQVDFGSSVHRGMRRSTLAEPLSRLLPVAFEIVKQYAPDVPVRDPFRRPASRTARSST